MFKVLKGWHALFFLITILVVSFLIMNIGDSFLRESVNANTDNSLNWGLSFKNPGKEPKGVSTPEFLRQYDAWFLGDTNEKTIYLTFDAGYENGYTPQILDALKKYDVKATFFLVGSYIKDYPDIIKRMVEEGHIVGNHTMSHQDMSKITDIDSFNAQLKSAEEIYKEIVGEDMQKFYRPPSGKYNIENLKMAKELGYKTIFWSLAYSDWDVNDQPSKKVFETKLMGRMHQGAIILLHSTSKTNAEELDGMISNLISEGYKFANIDTLS